MLDQRSRRIVQMGAAVAVALIFFFGVSRWVGSEAFICKYTEAIDRNRTTVLKLTASSAAASTAITILPGDVATPIAQELAALSKGFLVALCALYLEKFLVTVSGVVSFRWLVPAACGLFIAGVLTGKNSLRTVGYRVFLFALALVLVVPASLKISGMIENAYQDSINQVISSASDSASQIQDGVSGETEASGLEKMIDRLKKSGDQIAGGASQLMEYFERLLSGFVESLAIMVVISCLIPLLVLLFFVWLVKCLFFLERFPIQRRERTRQMEREADVKC